MIPFPFTFITGRLHGVEEVEFIADVSLSVAFRAGTLAVKTEQGGFCPGGLGKFFPDEIKNASVG